MKNIAISLLAISLTSVFQLNFAWGPPDGKESPGWIVKTESGKTFLRLNKKAKAWVEEGSDNGKLEKLGKWGEKPGKWEKRANTWDETPHKWEKRTKAWEENVKENLEEISNKLESLPKTGAGSIKKAKFNFYNKK